MWLRGSTWQLEQDLYISHGRRNIPWKQSALKLACMKLLLNNIDLQTHHWSSLSIWEGLKNAMNTFFPASISTGSFHNVFIILWVLFCLGYFFPMRKLLLFIFSRFIILFIHSFDLYSAFPKGSDWLTVNLWIGFPKQHPKTWELYPSPNPSTTSLLMEITDIRKDAKDGSFLLLFLFLLPTPAPASPSHIGMLSSAETVLFF